MLLSNQIKHRDRSVIVNKPALQAWLHAWTTGASFALPTNPVPHFQKGQTIALPTLRRLRSKMTK